MSSIEALTDEKPVLNYLHMFGAQDYVRVDASKRANLDEKANRCMFLGYSDSSKAYRVWGLDDQCVFTSRSILLDEPPPASHRAVVYVRNASFPLIDGDFDDDDARAGAAPDSPRPCPPRIWRSTMTLFSRSTWIWTVPTVTSLVIVQTCYRLRGRMRYLDLFCATSTVPRDQIPSAAIPSHPSLHPSVPPTSQYLPARRVPRLPPNNRPVFGGGSTRPRLLMYDQPRLLTHGVDSDAVRHDSSAPLLVSSPGNNKLDRLDESESKRQRVDEYEIALAVSKKPRSYAEAMASPEAGKWKETSVAGSCRMRRITPGMRLCVHTVLKLSNISEYLRGSTTSTGIARHKARLSTWTNFWSVQKR